MLQAIFSRVVVGLLALLSGLALASGAHAGPPGDGGKTGIEAAAGDREFNVRDYGVDDSGQRDAQTGIAAALKAAGDWTGSGPGRHARVVFPPGTYDISAVKSIYAIRIVGLHDIEVRGTLVADDRSRSTVLVGAPADLSANRKNVVFNTFFDIESSKNVVVSGFYLDKRVPYFSQGTVVGADKARRSIDVSPEPGYLDIGGELSRERINIVSFFDDYASRTWDHSAAFCGTADLPADLKHSCSNWHVLGREPLGDGTWRLMLDRTPAETIVGKKFLLWRNVNWQYGILVDRSTDVTIQDIFYTGGGGPAVHIQASDGLNAVRGLVVDVPKGQNRLFAATSGVNGIANRGRIALDHVSVSKVDDDAFHIAAGRYYPVLDQSASRDVVVLGECYPEEFRAGDRVSAFDWALKAEAADAIVTDARITATVDPAKSPRQCTVVLDRPLPPLHGLGSFDPAMVGRATDNNDRIVNHSQSVRLRITDSTLSSMRAHCGIIQVPASYSGNRCSDTPYAGLLIGPEYPWGEGYAVNDVTIEKSVFDNIGGTAICVGDSEAEPGHPGITSTCGTRVSDFIGRIDNGNIVIRGNAFTRLGSFASGLTGVPGLAISIGNAFDTRVVGNKASDGTSVPVSVAPRSTRNVQVQD